MKPEIGGYNIIELGHDFYHLEIIGGSTYHGTFAEIVLYAVIKLGFKMKELEQAIDTMVKENHNAMHFGMWCTFIYSYTLEPAKRRAS